MDIKESLMMQQNTKEPDKKNEDRITEVPEHTDREVEDIVEKYGELAELQNELKKQKEQEAAERERKRKQKDQRERNLHRSFHI